MRTPSLSPKTRPRGGQLATFGAVSVVTTVLDLALFNLLVLSDTLPPVVANTVSYGSGIVASYLLNKHLTFSGGGRDKRSHEIALFVGFNLGALWVNNAAVALTAWGAGGSPPLLNAAKLAAGATTWLAKFAVFERWVYPVGEPPDQGRDSPVTPRRRVRRA